MMEYNPKDWHFINMNSPSDLYAEYQGGTVALSEYDGCRDGHALLSEFAVDENMYFSTQIIQLGQGVGIGLYYGDGCFSDYILIAAQKESISVRIPSGVPQGDTFRRQGALRYYTVAHREYVCSLLRELAFEKKGESLTIYADGSRLMDTSLQVPFGIKKNPKIMIKALNETDLQRKSEIIMGGYIVNGIPLSSPFVISCVEDKEKTPWINGSVHILGEYEKWVRTNNQGEAFFEGLPFGEYRLVFGRENEEFMSAAVTHDGTAKQVIITPGQKSQRENIPQENLRTSASYIGLNGLWSFDLDKEKRGEQKQWYLPGQHKFKRCIRVPFSWQSLAAFGEEELINAYTLHQANSYLCTAKEVGETGWYQRSIEVSWLGETELVFAAASGIGKVWIDGAIVGCLIDSYDAQVFSLGTLEVGKEYTLTVKVQYEHGNACRCSGKQGFWFTDSPGIWQNVWLRERYQVEITQLLVDYKIDQAGAVHINAEAEIDIRGMRMDVRQEENVFMLSHCSEGMYKLEFTYSCPFTCAAVLRIDGESNLSPVELDAVSGENIYDKKSIYFPMEDGAKNIMLQPLIKECQIIELKLEKVDMSGQVQFDWDNNKISQSSVMEWVEADKKIIARFDTVLEVWEEWSVKSPRLYKLAACVAREEAHEVSRNVGLRSVGTSPYSETLGTYITINGEKTYIRGVLDQGYNPWGIYTYPSLYGAQPGSAAFDVQAADECGYNLMRMHIKDNEPDWYNICDTEGILVWDEIPCNFYGTAHERHWQSMYQRQLRATVRKHNYHPSVILCSTINESWGISGDHEKSPWDDKKAQELIKSYAVFYKSHNPHALVIDNSGYGKSSETQVLDYHSYPRNFEDAHHFFEGLSKINYPGSVFNCYHEDNKSLMREDGILDLLQRTSAQNLREINYIGKEFQSGQPVLLSEFVHTDRQEELIRIYPKIAGYVRMNLASAENEDTSPYTCVRTKRDFGFVDSDLSPLSYQAVNAEDFVFMDLPFLSKVTAKDVLHIPVHASFWSKRCKAGEKMRILFSWNLISGDGREDKIAIKEALCNTVKKETAFLFGETKVVIPEGYIGGYLFAEAYTEAGERIGVTSVQFEIFPGKDEDAKQDIMSTQWNTAQYQAVTGFAYSGFMAEQERNLFWGFGSGRIVYHIPAMGYTKGKLILEASACDLLEGTKITDENAQDMELELYLNGRSLGVSQVKALSADMRALFSNSSGGEERVVDYCKTGRYGYGSKIEIPVILSEEESKKHLTLEIVSRQRGVVLYGRRMGRYGCNPLILWEA